MPDRVIPDRRRVLVEGLVVLTLFAALGAAGGWVWQLLWDPPVGVVAGGDWYPSEITLREVFGGTAWYCVVAAVAGALLGAMSGWIGRSAPVVNLVLVVLSSLLAAWLMFQVGTAVGPPDPQVLAAGAEDGTRLPAQLSLEGGRSPYLVWPMAALIGLMVTNFLGASSEEIRAREAGDPQWLARNQPG